MDANELRAAFTGFFAARDHEVVPSASLIPHDPTVLFTIAGMVPFKPYFLGDEPAPWPRATTVQKCFRTNDIDVVGHTRRHCTFFEMLGNFSFGDYFKERAVPFAWELVTDVLGVDPERLWITVHLSDDEAAEIWADAVGVPAERIQRMGEDNFWQMGDTGPCGPCSEIYFDKGERYGEPGGPAHGGAERYVEIWNLVFMQYNRSADGTMTELPKKNIDTGAGLERILPVLAGTDSIFDTDVLAPLIGTAEEVTGARYGSDGANDVALRVMADHGRAMTMLVADGVIPSNDGRGYVLRRIIRRAVLAARRAGARGLVTPRLADTTARIMGAAYPNVREEIEIVTDVLEREESGFDRTLRTGLTLLEGALSDLRAERAEVLPGETAFRLHDTHGFPIELTEELARDAGVAVDRATYDEHMAEQRRRARQAAKAPAGADEEAYRELLDTGGPTMFVGRSPQHYAVPAQVIGVLAGAEPDTVELFLDRTPFYAEGGGQVGDTGTIVTETGRAEVLDTVAALPGLTAHRAKVSGEIYPGQDALAAIDGPRREATRRNHTGTHLLHAALREVLGDHVRQQGSLVAPDRLRFDFTHRGAPAPEELDAVTEMANRDVLTDDEVVTMEVAKSEADQMGAIAFFGDKYGDLVRVVRAGAHSLEFCGGTHVDALGMIGPIAVVSEGSIGSNTRRIEAVTGAATLSRLRARERLVAEAAGLLKVEPDGLVDALQRLVDRERAAERELSRLRASSLDKEAADLASTADAGVVVARRDGRSPDELRALAQATRGHGLRAVAIGGSPDGERVGIAVATGGDPDAASVVRQVAGIVGGGGGGSPQLALAGGREAQRLDEALGEVRRLLAGP
ncbi:MAG TPA: alanine--tRNA ligase [Acidimicrobiales bacterium]|nr:alanine--tRNA ligase [Acidimicrobiales bacterium]